MQKKLQKLQHPIFTEAICFWAWMLALFFFPVGLTDVLIRDLEADQKQRAWLIFSSGSFFLLVAIVQTYKIWRYFHGAEKLGGEYFEFNGVQLRILHTPNHEIVFHLADILDSLGVHNKIERRRITLSLQSRGQLYGGDNNLHVRIGGLWAYLESKTGRDVILLKQYLMQIPEFRPAQDVPGGDQAQS